MPAISVVDLARTYGPKDHALVGSAGPGNAAPAHRLLPRRRALLTFVVPVAFATTFPAQALLGTAAHRLLLAGIALAAFSLVGSHGFWSYAVRQYASASS